MNVLLRMIFIKFCLSPFALSDCLKIHHFMTEHEIQTVFNSKPETIPDYEIVPIFCKKTDQHARKIRSYTTELSLTAFKQDIILYLEPIDHVLLGENTPVYSAEKDDSEPLGVKYTQLENVWPNDFRTYQDPNSEAAITIDTNANGQMYIDGIIGNMLIKPLPRRVQKKIHRHFTRNVSGFKNKPKFYYNNSENAVHHVVYKQNNSRIFQTVNTIKTAGQNVRNNVFNFQQTSNRYLRSFSEVNTVYPEILIMTDYAVYKAHGKDVKALTKYMAAFWNGVDLRYRKMDDPKVRLNIAGLIISMEEAAAPYMKYYGQTRMIEDEKTLKAIGQYMYNEKQFSPETFDITVVITNLDMCMVDSPNFCNSSSRGKSEKMEIFHETFYDPIKHQITGLAFYGGACKYNFDYTDASVVLLEDSGGFDGIATAAHEIGHLLGAPHDGKESPNYIRGPGSKSCNWNNGYLMSSKRHDSKGLQWSSCSIKAMRYFLKKDAFCLQNKPNILKILPKLLPGQLLSRNEQCMRVIKTGECKDKEKECGRLWCMNPYNTSDCVLTGAPAEGSLCDNRGVCLDGLCISRLKE